MRVIYNEVYFNKQIKPKLDEGWSVNKIAKFYNIGDNTVRRTIKHYGGVLYKDIAEFNGERAKRATFKYAQLGKQKYDKQQEFQKFPKIIKLIQKGLHVYEISNELNLCYKSITRIVNKLGTNKQKQQLQTNFLQTRDKVYKQRGKLISQVKSERNNKRFLEIVPYIEQGLSAPQISEIIKVNYGVIRQIVKRCGTKEQYQQLIKNGQMRKREAAFVNLTKLGTTRSSKPQQMLFEIILKYFEQAIYNLPIKNSNNRFWIIDIAIPNYKIAIEYDGSFWHQNKEKDKIRDKSLLDMGWKTIRMHYINTPSYLELEKDFLQLIKEHNIKYYK
jgi:transposase